MLAQLRAAVAAYASADHCRVLRHCRLTSWPITSCAIAVVLPATEWAELLSPAVHLLEHWLRAELCDCLQRLKRIAALHAGKGSTLAALRHLHARSVLRFETWQQSVVPLGLECECSIGALGGSQHLDSVCAGEPSPLGPAAQRLLADALFTSAFGMHHRASSDADAERAVASYRQCSYLLQHALAIQEEQLAAGSIQELTVLCTRLALAQAAAGRGDLRAAREALEALLPAMRSTLGVGHPQLSQARPPAPHPTPPSSPLPDPSPPDPSPPVPRRSSRWAASAWPKARPRRPSPSCGARLTSGGARSALCTRTLAAPRSGCTASSSTSSRPRAPRRSPPSSAASARCSLTAASANPRRARRRAATHAKQFYSRFLAAAVLACGSPHAPLAAPPAAVPALDEEDETGAPLRPLVEEAARLAVALTPHFQRSHFSFEVPVEMVHWLSDGDPRRRRSDCGDLPRSTFYGQCRWDEAVKREGRAAARAGSLDRQTAALLDLEPLPLDGLLGRRDPESARMQRNLGCPDLVALVEDAAEEEPSAEVW